MWPVDVRGQPQLVPHSTWLRFSSPGILRGGENTPLADQKVSAAEAIASVPAYKPGKLSVAKNDE